MKTDIINFAQYNTSAVVALGKFDGIHIGHARLLSRTAQIADNAGCAGGMYVISLGKCELADEQDMHMLAKELGLDVIYTDMLTPEYMSMSPQQFVYDIIRGRLNAKHVVVGYNYRFGKDRCGNTALLRFECAKYNIKVTVIDCVTAEIDGENIAVSSTEIRNRLAAGEVAAARIMLGRPYSIKGVVKHGRGMGHTIGFPTINLYPAECSLPLRRGVYITAVTVDGERYTGITNIGINPTVSDNSSIRAETHILDFDKDIYGKAVRVSFMEFLRDEAKFESLEQLAGQLEADKAAAGKFDIK